MARFVKLALVALLRSSATTTIPPRPVLPDTVLLLTVTFSSTAFDVPA